MDKYDAQIAKLLASENFKATVFSDWVNGLGLFEFVSPDGHRPAESEATCGCLTMVRLGIGYAFGKDNQPSDKLTKEIRADVRIPKMLSEVEPEDLPVFAEWQRRLDEEIRDVH